MMTSVKASLYFSLREGSPAAWSFLFEELSLFKLIPGQLLFPPGS